jgi:DNA-binding transcriptional ArsR family regulator
MVKYSSNTLDATFSAVADPIRRAILTRLAHGEASVTELAGPFNVSLPAISKHLRVLETAGLLSREKDGRIHRIRLAPEPLKQAAEWIAYYRQFWEEQLDRLSDYLNELNKKEEPLWSPNLKTSKPASSSNGRLRSPGRRSSGRGPKSRK